MSPVNDEQDDEIPSERQAIMRDLRNLIRRLTTENRQDLDETTEQEVNRSHQSSSDSENDSIIFNSLQGSNRLSQGPEIETSTTRPANTTATAETLLNLDSTDPLNQSLMVDIDDAESISRLVELGFEESLATNAFFAAERNLETAIDFLLDQNTTD